MPFNWDNLVTFHDNCAVDVLPAAQLPACLRQSLHIMLRAAPAALQLQMQALDRFVPLHPAVAFAAHTLLAQGHPEGDVATALVRSGGQLTGDECRSIMDAVEDEDEDVPIWGPVINSALARLRAALTVAQ